LASLTVEVFVFCFLFFCFFVFLFFLFCFVFFSLLVSGQSVRSKGQKGLAPFSSALRTDRPNGRCTQYMYVCMYVCMHDAVTYLCRQEGREGRWLVRGEGTWGSPPSLPPPGTRAPTGSPGKFFEANLTRPGEKRRVSRRVVMLRASSSQVVEVRQTPNPPSFPPSLPPSLHAK